MNLETKNMLMEFKNDLMLGINEICTRLERIEERMDRVEERLDALESKVDNLEKSFEKFKVETRKNFKRIDERFNQIDAKFEHIGRKLDELRMNMDQRFNLLSDQLDILNGRKPKPSPSIPSQHPGAQELRETPAPYVVHDIDMTQAVLANKDLPEKKTYLLSRFTASESELLAIRHNLINQLLDARRSLKRTDVLSPELLVKRESLISSLSDIIDRLFSFAYIPQGMDALNKFVEKNGKEALLQTWNDSHESYKKMESKALSLLEEAVEFCASLA